MEKLDLSTHAKDIKDSYEKVVNGAAERYTIFTVDKASLLTASEVVDGEIVDFVEEFEDGKVQFGLAKVSAPGSDVKKLVLLGWCPDNSPLKSKISFGANFGEVAKVLRGYHVQITARDRDDLDVESILKTVSDAAGARYSIQSLKTGFKPTSASKPAAPVKPVQATKPTVSPIVPKPAPVAPKPVPTVSKEDDDEWDGEEESEVRDFQEKPLKTIPGAYKPVKVDIDTLRKGKSDTTSSTPKVVEPAVEEPKEKPEPKTLEDRMKSYTLNDSDGRLSSLPKPKPSGTVTSRYHEVKTASFGTKPPAPMKFNDKDRLVGGLNKNFGDNNGKTPAQIWAEKHGQYKQVETNDEPVNKNEIESDYVVVPSKVPTHDDDEEVEEEEEQELTPAPPPPVRNIPPPRALSPEPESEPELEPEAEEEPEPEVEEPALEPEPEPVAAPSLPTRSLEPEPAAPSLPTRQALEPLAVSIKAIAEYEYTKDEDNEIGFGEGDLIVDIEFIDDDWWSGKNSQTGESGLFPSSYVNIIKDDEEPKSEPKAEAKESSGKTAVAEYDYDATEDNELTFKEGDVITDIEFIDEDWWLGSLNGKRNLFPANYVSLQ